MQRRALLIVFIVSSGCAEPVANLEALKSALTIDQDIVRLTVFDDVPGVASMSVTVVGDAFIEVQHTLQVIDDGARYTLRNPPGTLAPGDHTLNLEVHGEAFGTSVARLSLEAEEETHEVTVLVDVVEIPDCDDDNPCTEDSFDREILACTYAALGDGAPCDDDNACTENTRCEGAVCLGVPLTCDDDVACTVDTCDPAVGCTFVGVNERCDDGAPCTDDVCSPSGCENPAKPLGSVCALNGCETIGLCGIFGCEDHAVPDGAPCEDGDRCTTGDTCQAGECAPGVLAALGVEPLSVDLDQIPRAVHDVKERDDGFEILWRNAPLDPCEINVRFLEPPQDHNGIQDEAASPITQVCRSDLFRTRWRESGDIETTFVAWTAISAGARLDASRVLVSDIDDQGNANFFHVDGSGQTANGLVAPIENTDAFSLYSAIVVAPGPDEAVAFAQADGAAVRFGSMAEENTATFACEVDRPLLDWHQGTPRVVVRERCAPFRVLEVAGSSEPITVVEDAATVALNEGEIVVTLRPEPCAASLCPSALVLVRDDTSIDFGQVDPGALATAVRLSGEIHVGVLAHARRVELRLASGDVRGRDWPAYFDLADATRGGPLMATVGLDANVDFDCDGIDGALCLPPAGPSASVARFGCIEPALCMVDDDCDGAEVCDHTTCHAPPDCTDGPCDPVCYGACTL